MVAAGEKTQELLKDLQENFLHKELQSQRQATNKICSRTYAIQKIKQKWEQVAIQSTYLHIRMIGLVLVTEKENRFDKGYISMFEILTQLA